MKQSHNWLTAVVILGLIAAVVIMSFGKAAEFGEISLEQETEDIITVSGTGEVVTEPDEATAYVEVNTLKATAQEAQDENARITNSVTAALRSAGVKEKDIETSSFNLYPKYEWNRADEKQELIGYEVRHTLKVKTSETDRLGEYLDAAVKAGANTINRVSFGLSKEKQKEVNAEALKKAAVLAKEKAESITSSLGVKLGELSSISESNYMFRPYDVYPSAKTVGFGMEAAQIDTEIAPGDITVSADVSLMYEIE